MRRLVLTTVLFALAASAGCSLSGGAEPAPGQRTVVLVTHDSFAYTKGLFDQFTQRTGITVQVHPSGDAGALTNQLVLTKANPIGDLAYGVDNTFATRALDAGVFNPYRSPAAGQGPQRYAVDGTDRLTAVDVGDVCVNIDVQALRAKGLAEPTTFEQLAEPRYASQFEVEDPQTSSPGLAFLLGTVAHFGDGGWLGYWQRLKAGGVTVAGTWEQAYTQDFSGAAGKGAKPIVVSYASSPAEEVGKDGTPRTKAVFGTCFRQVEYAGVLAGARNPGDAGQVLDFLLSPQFQADVPGQMYVYPARDGVALPADWRRAAPLPSTPLTMPGPRIQAGRDSWIAQWRSVQPG